jgi:hypothetical protein
MAARDVSVQWQITALFLGLGLISVMA